MTSIGNSTFGEDHDESQAPSLGEVNAEQESALGAEGEGDQEDTGDHGGDEPDPGERQPRLRELLEEDRAEGDGDDLRGSQWDSEDGGLEGVEAEGFDDEGVLDSETALEIGDCGEEEEDPCLGIREGFDESISPAC